MQTTAKAATVESVLKPMMLSHGTLQCRDLVATRAFLEGFLGLECVRHSDRTMLARKGGYWTVVCVQIGDKVTTQPVHHHFGVDMESREEVERAHELALKHKETYGLQKVQKLLDQHQVYSFYIMDCDGNWWEVQHHDDGIYEKMYQRGDIIEM